MKRLTVILAVVAIAATALSCKKENAAPVKMKTISVTLGAPEAIDDATKTYLVDHQHVYWRGDDVNIFCITTDGDKILMTSEEKTAAATKLFTAEIPEGKEPLYYYYDQNRTSCSANFKSGNVLREILPNSQSCWTVNSFSNVANFAIAKPGDTSFKNVHGYFKWTNNGNAIKSVKIETLTSGQYFAGYFDVEYNNDVPTTAKFYYNETNTTACSPYVTSSIGPSTIPEDQSYYAIIIPGEYNGVKLTITLAADNSTLAIKSEKNFTIERGKVRDLGVLPIAAITKGAASKVLPGTGDFSDGWILVEE